MTDKQMNVGDRVTVSLLAKPNGPGEITRCDEWTCTVRLDADGIEYLFGGNVVQTPVHARIAGILAKHGITDHSVQRRAVAAMTELLQDDVLLEFASG